MKKTRRISGLVPGALLVLGALCSCGSGERPSRGNPVTITIWHTMGGPMKARMDETVEEFNLGPGTKAGITVNTTLVADTSFLHEKLSAAAMGDPGALDLPDMAALYPNAALALAETGLLADLGENFSPEELARFAPEFLEEGRLRGETLYLLPFAKSTETLFVNTVIFKRFASDAGAGLEDLSTLEGIAAAGDRYFSWSGGKTFFHIDSPFNFFMIHCESLGQPLIRENRLDADTPAFRYLWDWYVKNAARGRLAIFEGYGNYLAKTGDIVCAAASSSGGVFYPASVTYGDNTKEDAEWAVLPFPPAAGGKKIAMQRGAGMAVIRSTPPREYAAMIFLKWFIQEERNRDFTRATSYLPVFTASLAERLGEEAGPGGGNGNGTIERMYQAAAAMRREYRFYIPPVFEGFEELQGRFVRDIREAAGKARERYLASLDALGDERAWQAAASGAFEEFSAGLGAH